MALGDFTFANPQAYSGGVDFSPLARLGALGQPRTLADINPIAPPASPSGGPVPSVGGTSATYSPPPSSSDVEEAIKATAAAAGMDVPTWKAIASIESSLNPSSNYTKPTQYKGLFQIGSRGDDSEWARHGAGNIFVAMDNARAAAALAAQNREIFKSRFGQEPTPAQIYMMHQQGPGFYLNGTMTNVEGNPYPGMSGPQTPQSFEAGWSRELERRARAFRRSYLTAGDENGG